MKIKDDLKAKGITKPDTLELTEAIQGHLDKMIEKDNETKEALEEEEKEAKKKITSDDIHEGFDSTVSGEQCQPLTTPCANFAMNTVLETRGA